VGFFGGTFTGLPLSVQEQYLSIVQPFIDDGQIQAIRLSTRPDFIDDEKLDLLKKFRITTIELGAQSMDDDVLKQSGRGHKAAITEMAAAKILKSGFRLGLQMMIGLPGDTLEKSLETARAFVRLGATDVRIYPAVVIKGTAMETLFLNGKYSPLTLEVAVNWTKHILPMFENAGINVIRIGLHPSEGLLSGEDIVAGPFHVSFKELVLTELWADRLKEIPLHPDKPRVIISVPKGQINFAVGYEKKNKRVLEEKFRQVKFIENHNLQNRQFHVDFC
jgi:histone acetyltransferase (RNA polymerase elongator complex component)